MTRYPPGVPCWFWRLDFGLVFVMAVLACLYGGCAITSNWWINRKITRRIEAEEIRWMARCDSIQVQIERLHNENRRADAR